MCQHEGHVMIDNMYRKHTHEFKQKNRMHSVDAHWHHGARNPICRRIKRNKNDKKSNQNKTKQNN